MMQGIWSGKALFVVAAWGASFVATRIALGSFTPFGLVGIRLLAGTLFLVAAGIAMGRTLLPSGKDLLVALFLGLVLGGHTLIQALGLQHTSAISTGWIIGFTPIPIALGGWLFLRERMAAAGWMGVAVAAAGVVLIVAATTPGFARARAGDALQILSTLTWTLYTLVGIGAVARSGALRITLPATACGAVILAATFPWTGVLHRPLTPGAVAAAAFLGIVCSGLGYLLWYSALREHGAARVGSYLYLEPFFTMGAAAALLGEPVGAAVVAGGILVLAGVWAVARGSRRSSPAEAVEP
jgi:drug/metabolite transporter (DMT)-like permease